MRVNHIGYEIKYYYEALVGGFTILLFNVFNQNGLINEPYH
jgi:hypothetical protein